MSNDHKFPCPGCGADNEMPDDGLGYDGRVDVACWKCDLGFTIDRYKMIVLGAEDDDDDAEPRQRERVRV